TFLMILCNAFNSALVGSALLTVNSHASLWNKRQNLRKNLNTPSIPLVFQGLLCSNGPKNISYMRKVSAPYCEIKTSGFTTLNLDFDIFSTSTPQTYLPFSSINSASTNSGLNSLNASISRT